MAGIKFFDTTLRDGFQGAGISFSVEDKLKIARALCAFGIDYIEGGWPGSNTTDEEFFKRCRLNESNSLKKRVVAFGSTRYKKNKAHNDPNLNAIVSSGAPTAAIFGKTWDLHVVHALQTTLEDNLNMIEESVAYLHSKGIDVIFDAEHFFDGYKTNPGYALATVKRAIKGGAINISLCDTNGGTLPEEISRITADVVSYIKKICNFNKKNIVPSVGIHAHNDSECGVANSIAAIQSGATLVQATINGIGERCGNANLSSIIPAVKIKLKRQSSISDGKLKELTELSRYVDEILNRLPNDQQPYVGRNAFAHKGGIHVSAVERHSRTYEHIDPSLVGNTRRIVISELSGKSNVLAKAKELNVDIFKDESATRKVIEIVKKNEAAGYQYEAADGSFAILILKAIGKYKSYFNLKSYRAIVEKDRMSFSEYKNKECITTEATLKLEVKGRLKYTVSEGDGPVNALDKALHEALEEFYPSLKEVTLRDFKVRVINPTSGTAASVRVHIESSDRTSSWGTVGVSGNIIDASWQALVDAIEYKLIKDKVRPPE